MEINNIDKIVRDSLKSRTIQPSNSAWERLSDQLDTAPTIKKRYWTAYLGYAATILLLISVGFFMNTDEAIDSMVPIEIVSTPEVSPIDIVNPGFKNNLEEEKALVIVETPLKVESKTVKVVNKSKPFDQPIIIETKQNTIAEHRVVAEKTPIKKIKNTIVAPVKIERISNSRIKIDSDALLYAVTHTKEELKEYYAKYNVDRDEVLMSIRKQLKRANLKIDAASMLADVEKSIDEDTFKRNFMKVVKGKVTGLASAFANRNK